MKYLTYSFLVIFIFSLVSCKSKLQISEFSSYYPLSELNGTYLSGETNSLHNTMQNTLFRGENVDYVTFDFNGKDSLKVKSWDKGSIIKESDYKGIVKDNYFEIYFSKKKLFIPLIIANIDYHRVRLGLTDDNKLLVHHWRDKTGGILLFLGDQQYDTGRIFERVNEWKIPDFYPYEVNGKWGCKSTTGEIVIPAIYDMMSAFDSQGIAKVKKDEGMALIDKSGKLLTLFVYTFIDQYDEQMRGYRVSIYNRGNKTLYGYIDTQGNIIVPVEYHHFYDTNIKDVKRVSVDGMIGFVTRGTVICPPVLISDKGFISLDMPGADPGMKYCYVYYQDKGYYLGLDGYLYPFSSNIFNKITKLKSQERIKIGYSFINQPDFRK